LTNLNFSFFQVHFLFVSFRDPVLDLLPYLIFKLERQSHFSLFCLQMNLLFN
jgi:hypothetical protein